MTPRDESLRLRAALHAYPKWVRAGDGDALLSLARELIDEGGSTVGRESLGLMRSGIAIRAGSLARAPWNKALRAVALPISIVLLSIALGAMSFWTQGLSWMGWSWLIVAAAPTLAIFGLLSGLRLPVLAGGLMICLLGVAQGNGQLSSVDLSGLVSWKTGGFDFPLLGCAFTSGILITVAGFQRGQRAGFSKVAATLAWVIAGTILVRLLYPVELEISGVSLNGLAICFGACLLFGVGGLLLAALRRADPTTSLCGLLYMAVVMPILVLYGVSRLELGDSALLVLTMLGISAGFALLVRLTGLTAEPSD